MGKADKSIDSRRGIVAPIRPAHIATPILISVCPPFPSSLAPLLTLGGTEPGQKGWVGVEGRRGAERNKERQRDKGYGMRGGVTSRGGLIRALFLAVCIGLPSCTGKSGLEDGNCAGGRAGGEEAAAACNGKGRLVWRTNFSDTVPACSRAVFAAMISEIVDLLDWREAQSGLGDGVSAACQGASSLCEREKGTTGAEKCGCWQGVCDGEGGCKCNAEWYGQLCDVSPIRQAYYMPRRLPEYSPPSLSGDDREDGGPVGVAIMEELDALQHPAPGLATLRIVKGETKGLGAWVHHVVGALTQGFKDGVSTALLHPYDYFLHGGCPPKGSMDPEDASCMFEPLFSSEIASLVAGEAGNSVPMDEFWQCYMPPDAYKEAGIFNWNSVVASYVVSPNRKLQSMLQRYKEALGWPPPGSRGVIGVHIRRGDACLNNFFKRQAMHHAELMPKAFCADVTRDVMPAIALMARAYSLSDVFVSTDDPSVLRELQQTKDDTQGGGGFRWMGVDSTRNFLRTEANVDISMRLGTVDRRAVGESALLDSLLLSECACLVLQLSGEFSRLALELAFARTRLVPPYISLDSYAWAPRYGLANLESWWEYPREITLPDLLDWKKQSVEA